MIPRDEFNDIKRDLIASVDLMKNEVNSIKSTMNIFIEVSKVKESTYTALITKLDKSIDLYHEAIPQISTRLEAVERHTKNTNLILFGDGKTSFGLPAEVAELRKARELIKKHTFAVWTALVTAAIVGSWNWFINYVKQH